MEEGESLKGTLWKRFHGTQRRYERTHTNGIRSYTNRSIRAIQMNGTRSAQQWISWMILAWLLRTTSHEGLAIQTVKSTSDYMGYSKEYSFSKTQFGTFTKPSLAIHLNRLLIPPG